MSEDEEFLSEESYEFEFEEDEEEGSPEDTNQDYGMVSKASIL